MHSKKLKQVICVEGDESFPASADLEDAKAYAQQDAVRSHQYRHVVEHDSEFVVVSTADRYHWLFDDKVVYTYSPDGSVGAWEEE